jgi:outer membrane murein-binding lipoprotein Lpp
MDKLPRVTTLFPLASIFLLLLSGCENHKPKYEELMNDNQQLHAQLDATSQKIQDARSNLDSLRTEIGIVESEPCHEDSAGDLSGRADDIDSDLDEAQQESQ